MAEIRCPECASTYQVSDETLGSGRKVRCAACRTTWLARAVVPDATEQDDDAIAQSADGEAMAAETDAAAPADDINEAVPPPPPIRPRRDQQRPWHQRIAGAERPQGSRAPMLAALALGLVMVAAVGLRATIVRHVPDAGRVYAALGLPVNLTGLELTGIKSGVLTEDGVELLVVQGEIANVSGVVRTVPRLRFAVLDARGVPLYAWTAQSDARQLQPGERQTFRRRLASPPPEGREVLVRFASKADLVALAQ